MNLVRFNFKLKLPLETIEYLRNKLSSANSKCESAKDLRIKYFSLISICHLFFQILRLLTLLCSFNSSHENIIQLAEIFYVQKSETEIFTNNILKIDCVQSGTQVLSQLNLGVLFASKD